MDARLAAAILDNARWCHLVCSMHGITGRFDEDAWVSARRTPPMYPDASPDRPRVGRVPALAGRPDGGLLDQGQLLDAEPDGAGFRVLSTLSGSGVRRARHRPRAGCGGSALNKRTTCGSGRSSTVPDRRSRRHSSTSRPSRSLQLVIGMGRSWRVPSRPRASTRSGSQCLQRGGCAHIRRGIRLRYERDHRAVPRPPDCRLPCSGLTRRRTGRGLRDDRPAPHLAARRRGRRLAARPLSPLRGSASTGSGPPARAPRPARTPRRSSPAGDAR